MAVKAEKAVKAKEAEVPTEVIDKVAEEPAPAKKEAAPKKAAFFMYLGPTIVGVIQHASIYSGEDKALDAAIEKFPRIKALLIPDNRIAEDRINVTKPGTRLYAEYHRLVNELKK